MKHLSILIGSLQKYIEFEYLLLDITKDHKSKNSCQDF